SGSCVAATAPVGLSPMPRESLTMKRALVLASIIIVLLASAHVRAQETPRVGGVLKVATVGEPPTLDIQMSTTVITYEIMWHVFESLFTYDPAFNPIPLLAESHEVGDGGLPTRSPSGGASGSTMARR